MMMRVVQQVPGFYAAMVRLGLVLTCAVVLLACAAKPPATMPARPAAVLLRAADTQFPQASATCKLEGCCPGRGEVAFLQSDWYVVCRDGLHSDICDCH